MHGNVEGTFFAIQQWHGGVVGGDYDDRVRSWCIGCSAWPQCRRWTSYVNERHTRDLEDQTCLWWYVCGLFEWLSDKGKGIEMHCSEAAASFARGSMPGKCVHAKAYRQRVLHGSIPSQSRKMSLAHHSIDCIEAPQVANRDLNSTTIALRKLH